MKLDHGGAALKVESSHDFESAGFNIKASPIAFQVLSSGLYQDKIAAVIRELSTNAYDGHRLREMGVKNPDGTWAVAPIANRTKLPFKVELPSTWNPVFAVRDYGVGLDHDGIMRLYTTYFGSTKSDSNDFVGALGLGSKSPFSMASSFLVISYYNGIKRTYTAMIGEDGFPTIVKMDEVNTTEENGLEVRVTVDPSQIHMFKDRAAKIYAFFETPPNVPGLTINKPEYESKTRFWGIRKRSYGVNLPAGVIMGQICYPITLSALEGKVKPHIYKLLQQHAGNIDIFCEMADVEFQASREALSYTPKTFAYFDNALEEFYKEIRTTALDGLTKCSTYVEAVLYMRELNALTKQILEEDRLKNTLLYKGQPVDWLSMPKITGTCKADLLGVLVGDDKDPKNPVRFTPKFKRINPNSGNTEHANVIEQIDFKKKTIDYSFSVSTVRSELVRVVFNDSGATMTQIRRHLSAKWNNKTYRLYLVDKKNEDVAKFLAKIHNVAIENISTWGMTPADACEVAKLARVFKSASGGGYTERLSTDAELKKIKYYMCSNGNAHNYDDPLNASSTNHLSTNEVNDYFQAFIRYGLLDEKEHVAIVPKSKEAEFKKAMPNILHITEIKNRRKWSDFTLERQREISAVVFRTKLKDNRFNQNVDQVIAEYNHFLTALQSLPHVPAPVRVWAASTLNNYKKLAVSTFEKLSKQVNSSSSYYRHNRPIDPKPFIAWIEETFKGKLIDFQPDIDMLGATEKLLVDVFPVFDLLRQTYYKHTSVGYYNFTEDVKRLMGKMIAQDIDTIKKQLALT